MTDLGNALTYLRAMLREDSELAAKSLQAMNERSWEDAGGFEVGAAFYIAARRRFADADLVEIMTWVADLRAQLGTEADEVDPLKAEHLIRAMARQEMHLVEGMKPVEIAQLELLLTARLLQEWNPTEAELDRFFEEVRALAAEWAQDD